MIVGNIRYLRAEVYGLTQHQFADRIFVSRSRYASYESGRIEVPIDVLIRLSKFYNITIDVLLKVNLRKVDMTKLMKLDNNRILLPLKVDENGDDNYIELIPERISAGYLEGYADAEYIDQLASFRLPFLPTGKHRAFQIKGDSMLPTKSGSYIVGKYIESIKQIINGKTYVVLSKHDGCTYKRVYKDDSCQKLILKPDNPDFSSYEVHFNEVLELWEFTCCIQMQEYQPEDVNLQNVIQMLRELKVELRTK